MRLRLHPIIIVLAAAMGSLAGCSDYQRQERPLWRAQAEEACLAKGLVRESTVIRPFHELTGPGICGADHPFKVTALDGGTVTLNSTQTLDCPMIAALDTWIREVVQPAAEARFGEKVVRIDSMGSYNCRGINNMSGAGLSEHSFANAIDVGGFVLAGGRTLNIMKGFNGADEQVRAFLHEAHAGACSHFTTVLGPGYNIFHYNHFHMDLALHGATSRGPRRYCKPVPQSNLPEPPVKDNLPDPPPIEEEMDIARSPVPPPSLRSGPATLVASLPLIVPVIPREQPAMPSPAVMAMAPLAARPAPPLPHATSRPVPQEEPPLITFGEAPEAPAPPSRAPFGSERPANLRSYAARPLSTPLPSGGLMPEAATSPPLDREGRPQDWDVTSSIGR